MPGNLEKVGSFTWVGNKDALQKVAGVRSDVFGEGEGCGDNILVEKVDVVTFGVGWIIVKRKVSSQHSVL